MTKVSPGEKDRRSFLKYLAASPVLAASAKSACAATLAEMPARPADPYVWWPQDPNYVVEKPEDALDVFELETVAHKNVPAGHFGYLAGADDDGGVRSNREDISKFALRGHRLRDVRTVDTSVSIFGAKYNSPFFFCPVGGPASQHPDGFLGAARAAGRHNVAQYLSSANAVNPTIAAANKARNSGTPVFLQLYIDPNWEITKNLVQNAERDGAHAMGITVDTVSGRKLTSFERAKSHNSRICGTCHTIVDPKYPKGNLEHRVGGTGESDMFKEAATEQAKASKGPRVALTWETIKRIRDITKMDILIKGIMNPEDAAMCVKLGYGIHVSNHGGRQENAGASTISALPDIVSLAKGKVPIFIDGGFRRGMDIVKALAMGATMVGFGRPWLWGLGAFGEAGVERVITIIQAEIVAAMQQVGAASVKELTPSLVYRSL